MDLRSVFNSEPKSLFDTISESGVCFYLPAYQRPYSWNKKNVLRIFDDVMSGIENVRRNQDAITFIGTILTVHDTKFQTINPLKRGEVPAKVMLVIDGQQRLTSLLLISVGLHEFLSLQLVKIEKLNVANEKKLKNLDVDSEEYAKLDQYLNDIEWLIDVITTLVADLRHFVTNTNSNRDPVYKWYPKLIRSYVDCWSKTKSGALYESPVARILHAYNEHVITCEQNGSFNKFIYDLPSTETETDKHKIINDNYKSIVNYIKKVSTNSLLESEKIDLKEIQNSSFSQAFQFQLPDSFTQNTEKTKDINGSLFVILFAKYFLNRVCVTSVTVNDESYAFDMFEALNTTGEPLTSLETFKPKIVEDEGIKDYETSASKSYFDDIDRYLEAFDDAGKKHKETSRILLAFAMSETGERISKHISDQRNFLLNRYREFGDNIQAKREFIERIRNVVLVIYKEWEGKPELFSDKEDEQNLLELCFNLLVASKHEITLPLLQKIYSIEGLSLVERTRALQGITAFFALWRGAHSSTAGIDAVYRDIFKVGINDVDLPAQCKKETDELDISKLLRAFKHKLKTKISSGDLNSFREDWINQTAKIAIYNNNKPITRLFLLLAMHDCFEGKSPELLQAGTSGSCPMLNFNTWNKFYLENEKSLTIEHIIPQNPGKHWGVDNDNKDLVHTLGNLTILPKSENSSLGNKSWKHKKAYFKSMCSKDYAERQEVIADLDISDTTRALLRNSACHPYLESLSNIKNFDLEIVQSRGQNMLGIVFDRLIKWLD